MNRKEITQKLVEAFYVEMQCAKKCRELGYNDMAEQARHQAMGIESSADVLGINREAFVKAYREFKDAQKQEDVAN